MRSAAPRFVFVTVLLDVIGIGIVVPVLPGIVAELLGGDATEAARWYGPLVALYAIMQVLFAPLLGAVSDRLGRRPVLLASLGGMGISYLVLGFAPTLGWLFAGRALAGVTGATITTANAYMADVSTPETRAGNFGLIGAAFGVGFVIGPALGGLLGAQGLRVPFFAAAGVVFLNLLYGLFVLPESLAPEHRRAFAASDALPLAGLRHLGITPLVTGLAGVAFLIALAQRGLESVWVLHGTWRYGWSQLENGLSLALVGVGIAIVLGGIVRRVVPRIGEPRTVLGGIGILAASFVLYGVADESWMLLSVIPLASLGYAAGPALRGLVASVVPPERQGAVQGALAATESLTSVFAPLVATALFAAGTDGSLGVLVPGLPFFVGAGFLGLAGGGAWLTLRSRLGGAAGGSG